jgi:hypothetical protein
MLERQTYMTRINKNKVATQNSHILKLRTNHLATSFMPIHALIKNRRAVSAVISSMILMGAVTAIGLVALAYARSNSINYQLEYGQTVNSDIGKLKESITFEYAHYNNNYLFLYLMNSGTIDIEIIDVSVGNNPSVSFTMYWMNDTQQTQPITNHVIGKGSEAYVVSNLSTIALQQGELYTIILTTRSGSKFAYSFLV